MSKTFERLALHVTALTSATALALAFSLAKAPAQVVGSIGAVTPLSLERRRGKKRETSYSARASSPMS